MKSTQLRNIAVAVILLLVVIVMYFSLRGPHDESQQVSILPFEQRADGIFLPESSPIRDRIKVESVEMESVRRTVQAPATVEANPAKRANIFPPAGGRIVQLLVNMGDPVRADQPLFEIYSPEMAEVQAEYNSARSALLQAERAFSRAQDLHKKGIVSRRELEEAQTEFEIVSSEMQSKELKLRIFGMTEEDLGKPLMVRSPINGRVIDLQVAAGEYIAEPEEPLMIVADLSNVWVTASIQEKDIRFIESGSEVTARFTAYPGQEFTGNVLFISDILDEETRTTRVRIAFNNPDRKLKPGMFANVRFRTPLESAILLPAEAVLQRRDFNYVYVQTAPYTFSMRTVRTGESQNGKVIILSGLQEGEYVLVQNAVLFP